MRFHVLGMVTLNGGDAAILDAQVAIFTRRWPGCTVTASDRDAGVTGKYIPGITFSPYLFRELMQDRNGATLTGRRHALRRRRLQVAAHLIGRGRPGHLLLRTAELRALERLRGADVLAYTGGTTLTENYDIYEKLFDLDLARRLGRPLVIMQQSAGPFAHPHNRAELRRILPAVDLVLLRDDRSLGHVLDVGADPARCRVLPDTVFALVPDEMPPAPGGPRLRVAISLRTWWRFEDLSAEDGMRRYLESVRAAVTRLVDHHDAEVVFVSTCQGRPEYWADDSQVALDAVAGLDARVAERVGVDRAPRTAAELIEFLTGFDAMVSTRLHAGILAACAGVPTLAIAYEYKTHEVWSQLGLSDWVLDIGDLRPAAFVHTVDALLENRRAIRSVLADALPTQRDAALTAADLVADVLADRPLSAPGRRRR